MIANIFQLAAGILLGISSFIVKPTFQVPVFGKKLPGSLEMYKQSWVVRFGLILLIVGYLFPIIEWNPSISIAFLGEYQWIFTLLLTGLLVVVFYLVSTFLAKRNYNNAPEVGENDGIKMPGMIAIRYTDEEEHN